MGTLADKLAYLNATKEAIKTALQNKGITVLATDTFRSYAQKIANIVTPSHTTLSVTPSTSSQTITPSYPYNGFSQVNVSAVNSSIDSNIQAGNIKNGVSILGVTGTMTSGYTYRQPSLEYNCVVYADETIEDSGTAGLNFNASDSTIFGEFTAKNYDMTAKGLTADMLYLESIAFTNAGYYLLNASNFPNLNTVKFGGLTPTSGGLSIKNANGLFVFFFRQTEGLYADNTSNFGLNLIDCANTIVHFPATKQSDFSTKTDVIAGFGGTNTTIIYDL